MTAARSSGGHDFLAADTAVNAIAIPITAMETVTCSGMPDKAAALIAARRALQRKPRKTNRIICKRCLHDLNTIPVDNSLRDCEFSKQVKKNRIDLKLSISSVCSIKPSEDRSVVRYTHMYQGTPGQLRPLER